MIYPGVVCPPAPNMSELLVPGNVFWLFLYALQITIPQSRSKVQVPR